MFNFITEYNSSFVTEPVNPDGEHAFFSYDWHRQIEKVDPNLSGSVFIYNINDLYQDDHLGNIFYKNGVLCVTNTSSIFDNIFLGEGKRGYSITFKGQHTIFENEIICNVSPGEFNYSINPSAVVKENALFDVNKSGLFDYEDVDLILRYINRSTAISRSLDDGFVLEQDTLQDESWWNSDILITESEDVLWFAEHISQSIEIIQTGSSVITPEYNDYLDNLKNLNYLDINQDGFVDMKDGLLILNYFMGKRDYTLTNNLITKNSKRRSVDDIVNYLDIVTGKYIVPKVHPYFHNYLESSSLDKTGSYLSPFVTTIGLYENSELVVVAKLAQPVKILQDYPLNFIVRYDT
jgi:hypothetical protein